MRGARDEERGDQAIVEFNRADAGVDVTAFGEAGVLLVRTAGADAHGARAVGEPAGEIDVVDAAVEEKAAGSWSELDEETVRVDRVVRLEVHAIDLAEFASVDALLERHVGGVEAAREADHHHLIRALFGERQHAVALGKREG